MKPRQHNLGARACLLLVLSPRRTADLAEALGAGVESVRYAMERLAARGIVERDRSAKNSHGKPFVRRGPWKLTEDYFPQDIRDAMQDGLRMRRLAEQEAKRLDDERRRAALEAETEIP
jgi:predicted ArsR family transcriptional regulator